MDTCRFARFSLAVAMIVAAAAPSTAPAAETADLEFVGAPCRDAYTEIAESWGLDLSFDRRLKDCRVTLEMEDVTALQAIEALAAYGGHAIIVGDDDGLLVFDDTPQNRRQHTPLVMATLAPGHLPAKELDKLLRSLIEARRIAVNEQLQTVTMRDTASKVCIARRLLEVFDQPPSEIELDVQLLQLEGPGAGASRHRIDGEALRTLTADPDATLLASFGLALTGPTYARIEMPAPSDLPGTMALSAKGANPYGTRDTTLDWRFDWTKQLVLGEQQRTERYHASSETVTVSEGNAIVVPVKIESPERALVLTVEPRIVRAAALDPGAMESFEVGTEGELDCPELDTLAEALDGVELVRRPQPIVRTPIPGPSVAPRAHGSYDGAPRPYVIRSDPTDDPPTALPTPTPDGPPGR